MSFRPTSRANFPDILSFRRLCWGVAIDFRDRGRGYGRHLLADALYRAVRSEIASSAVIVDAKDEAAHRFYARESFLSFPDQPMKLFRPTADIAKLFE